MIAKAAPAPAPAPDPVRQRHESGILRRCGGRPCDCEHDEQRPVRRSATGPAPATAPPLVHDVLRSPGSPLDAGTRAHLEPLFGHDFSRVRVHSDARAAASARAVHARAYTVGESIVLADGAPTPGSAAGRRLLAHELAHVVQQSAAGTTVAAPSLTVGATTDPAEHEADLAADAVTSGRPYRATVRLARAPLRRQAYTPAEGTSVIVDTIEPGTFRPQGMVFDARMRREHYRTQAEATRAQAGGTVPIMDTGWARIRYDALTRELTLPVSVNVRGAVPADINPTYLNRPQPIPPTVDPQLVQRVADEYVRACNTTLNGWYEVVFENGTGACSGPPVPIRVQVTKTSATPDFTIVVSNLDGRSFVQPGTSPGTVMLFSAGLGTRTLAHEGTHMVLGHPDEYREDDPALLQGSPQQTGIERHRYDWSLSGPHRDYPRWIQLHQRHFSFVPVFLRAVMANLGQPRCRPVLREVRRPVVPEFRVPLTIGYASYGGGALHAGTGFEVGLDLNRRRDWMLFLGAHAHLMVPMSQQMAFLAGARMGLEYRTRPVRGGAYFGGFGEFGAATEFQSFGATPPPRPLAPFVGAGTQLGYSSGPMGGALLNVGAEAGVGMRVDQEALRWYRIGLSMGLSF
ncbi:MAG TPA: DUF4157 domain-containing protein [Actinophytocola sp.]|uniref:eCIS core domain-containing protein n=1 Tax=Actinophytocola sp. TaxID=1872138 RepID=UPI002DDD0C1F|nr:DUF4157 domain-containing protein [Actinophytocola sp.]HEV2777784.1 DUF4157 domain-containing protein [Actinophytocola sp.]